MWTFIKGRRQLREPVAVTPIAEPQAAEPVEVPTPAVVPVRFDPSAATVAQVLAYLAEHPADRRRVLAAERRGKARKGILGDD